MRFFILILILNSTALWAIDCRKNLEYQRSFANHENIIRELKMELREEMIDKCPRSKLRTKFCKNELKRVQKIIQSKDNEFLKVELNKNCAKQNKDIIKETRKIYTKTNKSGYFIAGAYREEGKCESSQQANQACRDVNKVLNKCKLDGNYLLVQCTKRSKTNSNNICYEASPILSLLTSAYSVCQVSVKDLEVFAPCLAQSAKDNRRRLCPNGCAMMPKTKMCNWTDDEVNNYLGCLQIATKEQYKKVCPERLEIKTPKKAVYKSKIKGCQNTRYKGKVRSWKNIFDSSWPKTNKKFKLIKTSATPREFLSLGFKVKKSDFTKEVAEGDDFAEPGESVEQEVKGSGVLYLKKAPGYKGIIDFSISKCPGLFKEDQLDDSCIRTTKTKSKFYWEVNNKTDDACNLDPDQLYFINIRFNRGCNWKSNCAVKIKNIRN